MFRTLFRYLSIKTTPNPLCKKFVPESKILSEGSHDIPSPQFATDSPLALELFAVKGIKRIFYAPDYISVTKTEFSDWGELEPQVSLIISTYLDKRLPLFTNLVKQKSNYDPDDEVETIIGEIIEGRIRPHVQEDGGDIRFVEFNKGTGIVSLEMQGSCAGCPSSFATLKDGIEKMLMFYIPEVKGVESLN